MIRLSHYCSVCGELTCIEGARSRLRALWSAIAAHSDLLITLSASEDSLSITRKRERATLARLERFERERDQLLREYPSLGNS